MSALSSRASISVVNVSGNWWADAAHSESILDGKKVDTPEIQQTEKVTLGCWDKFKAAISCCSCGCFKGVLVGIGVTTYFTKTNDYGTMGDTTIKG